MARTVGEHTEHAEEIRQVLNFVEHHQARDGAQGQPGILQFLPVNIVLEVEHGARSPPSRHHLPGESGLADPARPEQGHHRIVAEQPPNGGEVGRAPNLHDGRLP